MAEALKVLGQSIPAATTLTAIYTVPADTQASVSSIVVCNQSTATTFRVAIAIAGAADTPRQYLYYNLPLAAHDTFIFTIGISLATTDLIRAYSTSGNVSFTVFGVEVT